MLITLKQYKKIKNSDELQKSKNKAKRWFNLYCRMRDFSKADIKQPTPNVDVPSLTTAIYVRITGKCIACGKELIIELFSDGSIMNGRDHHASHYFNTDQFPAVEFDEDNVHCSCNRCNSPYGLHGNKDQYQINLIKKIGDSRFEAINFKRNQIWKPNILVFDEIAKTYKLKAKAEAKRLGIKI